MNNIPAIPARSRVAVADCPSYAPDAVAAALAEALAALGGLTTIVKPGQTVLLKPNLFCPHAPEDAITTHPEVVRQMILQCATAGAARIWVGDSPVGTHGERELWQKTGMLTAIAGTPAELKSWHTRQMPVTCGSNTLTVPDWYAQVDVVISLAKLKAHSLTTLSCALKNIYGLVSGPAKLQFHVQYPSPLAMSEFLVRVFAALTPHLTIADGVTVMEGNGPAHGRPCAVGVLLASRDAVALDAVACRALRIAPDSVPMIRLAAAQNLGHMTADDIDCAGSGLDRLQAARMRPSLARFLKPFPEFCYRLTPLLLRLLPGIQRKLCTRCGICFAVCPCQAIARPSPADYPAVIRARCISCFCCMESCPQSAIAVQLCFRTLFRFAQRRRRRPDTP